MATSYPKVSMIVLAYSHERYISACLESLAAVRYPNLEIVLLDDGSPDRTAEIAEEFAARSSVPVRIKRQPNTGRTAANTQKLIDITDGPYLLFMAGDDMLGPAFPLAETIERLEADSGLGFVLPRLVSLSDEPGQFTPHLYESDFLAPLRSGDPARMLKEHLYRRVSRVFLQGLVIRRDLIERFDGFETDLIADDYAFVCRVFHEIDRTGQRFLFEETALWLYRTHATNIHKNALRQITLIMEVVARYIPQEHWPRFDFGFGGLDTVEEWLELRQRAIGLLGEATGAAFAESECIKALRRARNRQDLDSLRQYIVTPVIGPRLVWRARRYYWRIMAQRFLRRG